jgi:hypothetical protein
MEVRALSYGDTNKPGASHVVQCIRSCFTDIPASTPNAPRALRSAFHQPTHHDSPQSPITIALNEQSINEQSFTPEAIYAAIRTPQKAFGRRCGSCLPSRHPCGPL